MVDRRPDEPRADETDQRNDLADQKALEHARGWRHSPAEHRTDLQPGTRAWRTDHTEVMLIETADSKENEVYLRVTDIRTGHYVQAPLAPDDLEVVACMLRLQAAKLQRAADRR